MRNRLSRGQNKWVRGQSSTNPGPPPPPSASSAPPAARGVAAGRHKWVRQGTPRNDADAVDTHNAGSKKIAEAAEGKPASAIHAPDAEEKKKWVRSPQRVENTKRLRGSGISRRKPTHMKWVNPNLQQPAALEKVKQKPFPTGPPTGRPGSTNMTASREPPPSKRRKPHSTTIPANVVKAGKWNTYVRSGALDARDATKPSGAMLSNPAAKPATVVETATPKTSKRLSILAATPLRRSARLKAVFSRSTVNESNRKKPATPAVAHVPKRAQRVMQLLRLGGRVYSKGNAKGKAKTLKLQQGAEVSAGNVALGSVAAQPKTARKKVPSFSRSGDTSRKPSSIKKFSRKTSASKPKAAIVPRRESIAARLKVRGPRLKGPRMVYCPVYCHTGQCPRRHRGCPLKHDPTKRAVCPRWLKGKCERGKQCLLQHQRRPELMPLCMHFLCGRCTDADCPYLHATLRPDAPPCAAFLRGYCAAGASCPNKHLTLRQIKDEHRLVAEGRGRDATKSHKRRKGVAQQEGESGDEVGMKKRRKVEIPRGQRPRRYGRYFDDFDPGSTELEDIQAYAEAEAAAASAAEQHPQGKILFEFGQGEGEGARIRNDSDTIDSGSDAMSSEEGSSEEPGDSDSSGGPTASASSDGDEAGHSQLSLPDFIQF